MKQHGLVGPLTTEHLAKVSWHIVELLTSIQVRELYEENAFHNIDVERTELYEVTETLVERFAGVRFDKHTKDIEPLTEEHLRDLIGDFRTSSGTAMAMTPSRSTRPTRQTSGHHQVPFF
ncbi:MAG: hypothetical protein IPL91_15940 [Hyphomicrobium sp.]|nr:hypothetical protein [Hyphomicrobium sp.]